MVRCCRLNTESLSLRGRTRKPVTLGLPGNSLSTWERQPKIAPNVDRIANSQPTPPLLPPRNSGSSSPNSFFQIFPRPCDSRNLNLSPFCNLATPTNLAKWQPAISLTYGNTTTDYISHLQEPLRLKYPSNPERELLVSLTQVLKCLLSS